MNILLVDDDVYVVQALRESLDFKAAGIDNIYYAYSVEQAKKIMESVPIHVLVSDIEMPKENGFALLEWIREKEYVVQEIVLTMYAEFSYAKKAIAYNCFAYALKPIDYQELQELIHSAVEKEQKLLEENENKELWKNSAKMIRAQGMYKATALKKEADSLYQMGYSREDRFISILVYNFQEILRELHESVQGMENWENENMLEESLNEEGIPVEVVYPISHGHYNAVLRIQGDEAERIEHALQKYFNRQKRKKKYTAGCYISKSTDIEHLVENQNQFEHYCRHKLVEPDEIIWIEDYTVAHAKFEAPDFIAWQKYILDGKKAVLDKRIEQYLEEQKKRDGLSTQKLHRLVRGFSHVIFMLLQEKGIVDYELNKPIFSEELLQRSCINATYARDGLVQMADIAVDLLGTETEPKTVLDMVLEYIQLNLDKDLNRDNLAEQVFLNPDYLARMFKKEMGMGISNYIQEKRMELAKEYLENSSEPINMVAVYCGYNNFSYFGKAFKQYTGMTPKDYRKDRQKDGKTE